MSENKITFPVKLASNNPQSFGIVNAMEVSGHKSVGNLSDLYAISDPVLSTLKDGSDAIGQEWFVVSEDCKYRLDNWENRKSVTGWTKLPKQELINTKQSVSEKDKPNGYAGLDSSGKIPIEKTYGTTATVTDVATYESLPATGLNGVIYYVSNTSAQYKWSGSAYIDITDGADNAKKNETSIFDCSNGTSTKYYSSLSEAINVVPPAYRTSNRIISYLSTENSTTSAVNYQYHGIDSTTWTNLTKWERVPNQSDLADLAFDVTFENGTIQLSGSNIGQIISSYIRCYCILGTVTKGNYLTYNIKSGYKLSIVEWDGIADTMSPSWHTESNGTYKINENYIHVGVGKVGDEPITPIEAHNAVSILYSEDLFPFIQNCYNNNDDCLLPIIWQQGTNGTIPGTIIDSSIRCISILNDTKSFIAYRVHSDYSIIILEWNDGDTTFYKPRSWFNGIGIYKAVKKNISITVKKNDESTISYSNITKDIVDIVISQKFNTAFEAFFEEGIEISKCNNFVQGTVQTSGSNIGQIISSYIRCIDVLDLPIGTGISVIVNSGYKATLACYSDGDTNATTTGFREGITTFRTFGTHAYLIVGKTDDSAIIPSEAIANVDACSSSKGNPILASINKLEEEGLNKIPYIGEALPFNKTMQIKEYKTIQDWVNSQAGTVFGDFLVVALAMDEVAAGNPNGHLYNINTGEHISNLSFGNTLNSKTYTMPHGNQICFGKEFYDENSVFPLLYVSQTTLYGDEALKGELGVLVYDIQKVSDTEYTPVLVQAIIPDLSNQVFRDKISKWTTNYVVDTDNDKLYLVGYPRMWDWDDIYNSVKGYYPISKFALPKVSDGEEIVLTNSMLEDNYQIYRETAIQMMLYYRGKIYIQGGFDGVNAPKYLDAVDLCNHSIVSQINLSSVRTSEPQGLFIYNNRLLWYDAGTSGKIDEFIFD